MAGELPPVVAVLTASSGDFMAKMATAKATMKDVSETGSTNFQKLSTVGGAALLGIAGAAVGVGVASAAMAVKFQNDMELIRTQAGASQTEVDKMSSAVLNMAGSVGTAPDVLAAGLYHVESAGYRGATALNILKIAAEGAKVGHADLEDVTNALDGAIVSGIKGVQDYGQAMGALNAIVGAGDMRMQDLANAMGTGIAATARTAGISLTDVGAALAVFGDNNIRGGRAAIYLRQALTAMDAPSKAAQGALASIGLTSNQLGEDLRKPGGLTVAMQDLKSHLDATGMDATQQMAVLAHAFGGAKTSTGVEILLSQLDRLKSKYADISSGAKNFGSDWQAQTKTVQFQLDQLGASLEATGIKIGTWLIPKLEDVAHFLEATVTWLDKNRDAAYALAAVVGGALTVAIGAFAINTTQKFIDSVGKAASSLSSWLSSSTSTVGLDAAAAQTEADAEAMGTSMSTAATSVEEAMAQMAAAVTAAAEEITASLTEVDGAIATTRAEAGSPLSMGGLVGPNGAPLSSAERGAAGTAESVAASGAETGLVTAGETGAGVAAAEGVAGGAGAGALGASVGLSSIIPAAVAGAAAYVGTHELLAHTPAGRGVTAAATGVANFLGVGPQQVAQQHLQADLGPASIQYLERIANATEKSSRISPGDAKGILAQLSHQQIAAANGPQTPGVASQLAKDATLQKQMTVLDGMKAQLAADTAKYGASSTQAHQDTAALRTTAEKWGSEHGISLKGIHGEETASFDKLLLLHADQQKLVSSADGNLKQSGFIKAVLDGQLKTQQSHLADLETAHASKTAIDLAKAEITTTHQKITGVQGHIDDLKDVASKITKTSDALSQEKSLESVMSKVNTDTSELKGSIKSGIEVTKLPSQTMKVVGSAGVKIG